MRLVRWLARTVLVGLVVSFLFWLSAFLVTRATGGRLLRDEEIGSVLAVGLAYAFVEGLIRLVPARWLPARLTGWRRLVGACAVSTGMLASVLKLIALNAAGEAAISFVLLGVFLFAAVLVVASGVAGFGSARERRVHAFAACLLALVTGFLMFAHIVYVERKALLAKSTTSVREQLRALEAIARHLPEFRERVAAIEAELERLGRAVPSFAVNSAASGRDRSAAADQLKHVARDAGLTSVEVASDGTTRPGYWEHVFTLQFEGSRTALERFTASVESLPRFYRVEDVFRPGLRGTIRLRTFARAEFPAPEPQDACASIPGDSSPAWLFPLEWQRQQLQTACFRRQQLQTIATAVDVFQAKERVVHDTRALCEQTRALPRAAIETEYTPRRLSLAELRVVSFEPERTGFAARILAPNESPLRLRAGDRLSDGVVQSIAEDHVIVERRLKVQGKPVTRQLRFSAPQPLPRVPLSHETTRITSPLLRASTRVPRPFSDDAPDYWAWLAGRYGAGVTRENNAAGRLHAALSTLVDPGHTFFDEMLKRPGLWRVLSVPWREQDCPECARRLEANEKPLAAIAEAVRRPRYFQPTDAGARASDTLFPSLLPIRHAANALVARGMLRVARGDLAGAAEDALAGQRLAALVAQGSSFIEQLMGIAARGISAPLVPLIACQASLTRPEAMRLLEQFERLPALSSPADAVDYYERFRALDEVLTTRSMAADRGPGMMSLQLEPQWYGDTGESSRFDPVIYLIPAGLIDWEEALRLINRRFDRLVAVQRAATTGERQLARAELEAVMKESREQKRLVLEKLRRGDGGAVAAARAAASVGQTREGRAQLAYLFLADEPLSDGNAPWRYTISWNESQALFRLIGSALALAVYKLDSGESPETLEALAHRRPGSPAAGYVISYRRSGKAGYAITAVPEEGQLTGNRGFCVDSTGTTRFTTDATAPKIVNGVCDPQLPLLR